MRRMCEGLPECEDIRRFKEKTTFGERKISARKHQQDYPNYIPLVLLSKNGSFSKNECFKVFIDRNENACQIIHYLKRKLNLKDSEASLFLVVNGNMTPKLSTSLDTLYSLYKDDDDLLYVVFEKQSFMG